MGRKNTISENALSAEHLNKKAPAFVGRDAAASARNSIDSQRSSPPSPLSLSEVHQPFGVEFSMNVTPIVGEEHLHTFSIVETAIKTTMSPTPSATANFNLSRFLWFATHLFVASKTFVHHHHQRSELNALRSEVGAFARHHTFARGSTEPNGYANDVKFLLAQIQEQEDELSEYSDTVNASDGIITTNADTLKKHGRESKSSSQKYANDIEYLLSEIKEQETELLGRKGVVVTDDENVEKDLEQVRSFFRLALFAIQEFKRKLF